MDIHKICGSAHKWPGSKAFENSQWTFADLEDLLEGQIFPEVQPLILAEV